MTSREEEADFFFFSRPTHVNGGFTVQLEVSLSLLRPLSLSLSSPHDLLIIDFPATQPPPPSLRLTTTHGLFFSSFLIFQTVIPLHHNIPLT